MAEIKYPHDSWILDESNSLEIKKLAKKYGVKHFSRHGISKYNQDVYPFMAKTKAGNVNAWIDRTKRRKYEYFVQLDIDHAPKPNYLTKTLGQFIDPKVGWVQSPSVYSNTDNWIARGAAEQELAYHGPIQMGYYGLSSTPMVVGSHCAYRMSAVNEIGGFQPTRAEDHLDTVAMVSKGWKGVFVPEVIAEGIGPETFGDYIIQQFAWAYSMFQVVMKHSPKYIVNIRSLKKLVPILFCETFYPFWAISYAITFFIPLIALAINHDIIKASWSEVLIRAAILMTSVMVVWYAGRPLLPSRTFWFSWRSAVLEIVRWPALLLAVGNALLNIKKPYMVTPKGQLNETAPPAKTYVPFVFLGLLSSIVILATSIIYGQRVGSGQLVFALLNTGLMALVCLLDLNISLRKLTSGITGLTLAWLKPLVAV
ncbi:MAG TPA: glycosyltransferase family 2 protein, partial [Candidatus Saccharimonadales bacterium]|nr:glycosyltransferase family 2 protein [Candidatus Saccharimonadales bacterium]